jgi:hypothetical protein
MTPEQITRGRALIAAHDEACEGDSDDNEIEAAHALREFVQELINQSEA